jgi:hypothetical protein
VTDTGTDVLRAMPVNGLLACFKTSDDSDRPLGVERRALKLNAIDYKIQIE